MALKYLNQSKDYLWNRTHSSTAAAEEKPVLTDEDEQFLNKITSQDDTAPQNLPVAGESTPRDAQIALMDGADNIPLPDTPQEEPKQLVQEPESTETSGAKTQPRTYWSWMRKDSRDGRLKKDKQATAASLMDVAGKLKGTGGQGDADDVVTDVEAKKEQDDMVMALEGLNLAAINNRVFSISAETQDLLQKFNIIFKDLINGVPTAYDDLEKLLTNSDRQLQNTFSSLPSFLQKLIEQLPNKMTKGFAPEIMAAAAERAQRSGMNMENAGKAAAAASKVGFKTPSLKDLIGKPGAVAGALRSIIQYLRARFPAFMGMNVLWSLALFVLLFVFWYCHKRGREVRLEKERDLSDDEVARLDKEWQMRHPGERPTTTAEAGASMDEVMAGMVEVEAAREAEEAAGGSAINDKPSTLGTTVQPAEKVGS